ncbi:MAG: hypothetical protein ACHQT8_01245 [Chlamydiales bacterium]
MQYIEAAKKLFVWNSVNLIQSAQLKKSEIGEYFAGVFQVKANGQNYDANHDNYFEFLNRFRSTISSIQYELYDFIVDQATVAIPLTAHIIRTNGQREDFEAILILKFNQNNKIILWHEVYVKTPTAPV